MRREGVHRLAGVGIPDNQFPIRSAATTADEAKLQQEGSTPPAGRFEGFEARHVAVNGTSIFARFGGNVDGPTLVLLHGFPETSVVWRRVAMALQAHYFIVLPDLRGYGDSAKDVGLPDQSNYSKRTRVSCRFYRPIIGR